MTNEKKHVEYIGYEYRDITVPREHTSLCLDSYPCFGWEPDPNRETDTDSSPKGKPRMQETVVLHFRRPRTISSKAELTRLQRNFDSCVAELKALERDKTMPATIAALAVGILGTAFMAGATFAAVAEPPVLWLTILLAIPGFFGWIVPYFLYQILVRKRTAEVEPLIEQKYDEIDEICEKGRRLLA